ncbi:MAG: phosphoribosylamine--glycine ligase [Betaproteobacteria bacterium]|nr:MAG: phosphoribosylamine--glycine ligase [Betaproteobacteria bacterium]TMH84147.1 MAG: phosphoribosylamine--glycine ligase [Betaproteobacteria bacterium]
MKLLVVGSGGREHAIAWRLAQSPRIQKVFVAPGNGGTAREAGLENVAISAIDKLAEFARAENIYLTVVGPEAPLAGGIVDLFRSRGLRILGPTQACARLESSKQFAKEFMIRHGIPTAEFSSFDTASAAHAYIDAHGTPIVVKADGLAAGKGVVVATSADEAHRAVERILVERSLGAAGSRVVIEGFLDGEEASFIVLADGEHVLPLATSQDHKRLKDGDKGPNTGGMGAYSPAPVVTPELHARVVREIIQPVLAGMTEEGQRYTGFLYAGLMIDGSGNPRVLEFNCRLGDPETQPILLRLKSDLFELIEHAMDGKLDRVKAEWDRRAALGVVLAAAGYPDAPKKGDVVTGLPATGEDFRVFHSGTALKDGFVVTSGGRVLCVTALGDSIKVAQRRAYEVVEGIRFAGMQYRRDIGHRAVAARRS